MDEKQLTGEFKNPSSEYRGKPFWAWNGKLDKDELLSQIDTLKDMGMGGYFCHSRTGLITEYLGKEWFDLINACAEKGSKLGLETWLYDEDRWPSGTAGGAVTENPDFRMHYLRLEIFDGDAFTWDDRTMAAFSVKLDGMSFTDKKQLQKGDSASGRTVLKFSVEEMEKGSFYNGNTYVDTMNREATEKFIELTHEKYKKACGKYFGTSIKGIFTDEPHRGAVMNGFGMGTKDAHFLTPYTPKLFEKFQEKYGYDLKENLPELFLWKNGEKVSPVKWQYMELIQELFLENYMKPIHDWCRKNNILFTGHLLHEDSLTAQACMQGSIMRPYEYMDCPGIDVLTEHNYGFWIVKQLQSAARQLGKKKMLSELYGCTGWQFNFESHKAVGDWQALFGINLRCHHLSWVSMQGEAKRDYPASIGHQSAWYKEYKYVEDYFSRINVLTAEGSPVCDLLVLNPIESVWTMVYPGWSRSLGTCDDDVAKMEQRYTDTFHLLCGEKVDFDYGDEDYLSRLGSVEVKDGEAVLKVGKAAYKSVLVTGAMSVRRSTMELLKKFIAKGGNVVFAGDSPAYIEAVKSGEAAALEGADYIEYDHDAILSSIKAKPFVTVKDSDGANVSDIYAQVRKKGDAYIVFLLNVDREKTFKDVTIELNAGGFCEFWDVRSGDVSLYAKGNPIHFTKDVLPLEEMLLVVTPKDRHLPPFKTEGEIKSVIEPEKEFKYGLTEPNVCVLDIAGYKINDEKWVYGNEILKLDRKLRAKFGLPFRGGEMLQPWFVGKTEQKDICRLKLQYSFEIAELPHALQFAVETPELFDMTVNNKKALTPSKTYWVDSCYKVFDIDPSVLKVGRNKIVLSTEFRNDLNLEAAFLLGDFGVSVDGVKSTLTKLPEQLAAGDIVSQGLPFYGAGVSYQLDVPEISGDERLFLEAESFDAACIKLTNGTDSRIIACRPYKADITELAKGHKTIDVEYVLTRRNTFGPLHQNPPLVSGYGPGNFVTEGRDFLKKSYGLLPQGMTGKVKLYVTGAGK